MLYVPSRKSDLSIPVGVLLEDFMDKVDNVSKVMYPSIKHLVMQQVGIAETETAQGQSTEDHKESTDNAQFVAVISWG